MSNTYTGNLEESPIGYNSALSQAFLSDRAGTLVEISSLPSGAIVDNIFYFNSLNVGNYLQRVIDGVMRAAYCGIYADGTDQSTKLNTALSAGVTTIIFDSPKPASYVINATITVPAGVTFEFKAGNVLSGTGTINGGIIVASRSQQIFATTLTVNPAQTTDGTISGKWYGAQGNNSTDDTAALQKALDMVLRNNTVFRELHIPSGHYRTSAPLIAYILSGNKYQFHTTQIIGDSASWGNTGTVIYSTVNDQFAIGFQCGKGCTLRNIQIEGQFTPPAGTDFSFYNLAINEYVTDGSRDNQYSPYLGVAIDPFTTNGSLPGSGGVFQGYPGNDAYGVSLQSYYTASTNATGGSSGMIIQDCYISGFVVGCAGSVNGQSPNADGTIIERVQFANIKVCVAGCQDQEDTITIRNVQCWGSMHTFFAVGLYGQGTPGNFILEKIQLAGRCIQFIIQNQGGYKPSYIRDVYAESTGQFGILQSQMGASVEDCEFDFNLPSSSSYPAIAHIQADGVTFKNCSFRMYGTNFPVTVSSPSGVRNMFENCRFEVAPYSYDSGYTSNAILKNCVTQFGHINSGAPTHWNSTEGIQDYAYGACSLFSGVDPYARFDLNFPNLYDVHGDYETGEQAITINTTNQTTTITVSSLNLPFFQLNKGVVIRNAGNYVQFLGIITAISGNTVTISYIPSGVASGTYYTFALNEIFNVGFLGDLSAGSNVIENAVADIGSISSLVNNVIYHPAFSLNDGRTGYSMVTAVNTSARTITVNQNAAYTITGVYFSYYTKHIDFDNLYIYANGYSGIVQSGGTLTDIDVTTGAERKYLITKSGYLQPPSGETRAAEMKLISPVTGATHRKVTASYTVGATDELIDVDASTGAIAITIPIAQGYATPGANAARILNIKKLDASSNAVNISLSSGTIDGAGMISLTTQYQSVRIYQSISQDNTTTYAGIL